jgi:hypothetical protein
MVLIMPVSTGGDVPLPSVLIIRPATYVDEYPRKGLGGVMKALLKVDGRTPLWGVEPLGVEEDLTMQH